MQRALEVLFSTAHTIQTRGCSHFTTVHVTRHPVSVTSLRPLGESTRLRTPVFSETSVPHLFPDCIWFEICPAPVWAPHNNWTC
jgi:hypothetical protein